MKSFGLTLLVSMFLIVSASADPIEGTMIKLPTPGGFALLSDGVTLVVSQPDKGELVFFDTEAAAETKRIQVEFKPGTMAVQNENIFVAAKGGSSVYVFDAKTGKQKREIKLGGDAIVDLACHPTKGGRLYASTTSLQVYSVDLSTGKAAKTSATGNFLAVDPLNGTTLYTGVQPAKEQFQMEIKDLPPNGKLRFATDRWGPRAFILKYVLRENGLRLASWQKNAACNAYQLVVTPDGKKVMMTSGGGWRPTDGGTGGDYMSAAFSTENLETRAGEAGSGTAIAFHPVLNLGILNHHGRDFTTFNPKTLRADKNYVVSKGADGRPVLFTFAARGTKVVLWNGENPKSPQEGLHFLNLPLSDEDRAALDKAYGKTPKGGDAPTPKPEPKPEPKPKQEPRPEPTPEAAPQGGDDAVEIAASGFNDASGLNADSDPDSPYPLGRSGTRGGLGERGWKGPWPGEEKATFVSDVVAEGDGALKLTGTATFGRTLAKPRKESFTLEMMLRCPAGGGGRCYVWEESLKTTGPVFGVANGKFFGLNGDGSGSGKNADIADCKPDRWYKLAVKIDLPRQHWTVSVDGQKVEKEFAFRSSCESLREVHFLVDGKQQLYLDAIRVLGKGAK
jgi:hypothetical protein